MLSDDEIREVFEWRTGMAGVMTEMLPDLPAIREQIDDRYRVKENPTPHRGEEVTKLIWEVTEN